MSRNVLALACACFFISAAFAQTQHKLIDTGTSKFGSSHHKLVPIDALANLHTPVNFYDGDIFARFELFAKTKEQPLQLNNCLYFGSHENCHFVGNKTTVAFKNPGVYYARLHNFSKWFKIGGAPLYDGKRPIAKYALQARTYPNATGPNSEVKGTGIQFRYEVFLVAKDKQFSPPEHWDDIYLLQCYYPGCDQNGNPANANNFNNAVDVSWHYVSKPQQLPIAAITRSSIHAGPGVDRIIISSFAGRKIAEINCQSTHQTLAQYPVNLPCGIYVIKTHHPANNMDRQWISGAYAVMR